MQPDEAGNQPTMPDADGYYGDDGGDDEVDLSFLDDNETTEE